MVRIVFLLLFSFCFIQLHAQKETAEQWNKANHYYADSQYNNAIKEYAHIIKKEEGSSAVYYNLGNTYFKLNNFDKAVISYKIALLKDYGNRKIKDNLNLAKSKQTKQTPEVKPIFFERWWKGLIHFISPTVWAVISLLCFILILSCFFAKKTGKKIIPYFNRFMAAYVVFFILLLLLAFASKNALKNDNLKILKLEQELNI